MAPGPPPNKGVLFAQRRGFQQAPPTSLLPSLKFSRHVIRHLESLIENTKKSLSSIKEHNSRNKEAKTRDLERSGTTLVTTMSNWVLKREEVRGWMVGLPHSSTTKHDVIAKCTICDKHIEIN